MFRVILVFAVQVFLFGFTRAECEETCSLCKEISAPADPQYIGSWSLVNPNSSRCDWNISCLYQRDDDGAEMCFCDPGPIEYEECDRPQCRVKTCNNLTDCDEGCTRCQFIGHGLLGICEGYENATEQDRTEVLSTNGLICDTVKETEDLKIHCPSIVDPKFIAIKNAYYGLLHDQSCSAPGALSIVEGLCTGKQACKVPANNVEFGDPCPCCWKSLRVCYTCITP